MIARAVLLGAIRAQRGVRERGRRVLRVVRRVRGRGRRIRRERLRCAGLMGAVKLMQEAYPTRVPYDAIKEACERILGAAQSAKLSPDEIATLLGPVEPAYRVPPISK